MKKLVVLLLTMTLLFLATTAVADYYANSYVGVILATKVSCRKAPDVEAEKFGSLKNSMQITVIGETGNYYIVALDSTGFTDETLTEAYITKDFVALNPYTIKLPYEMKMLIAPWDGAKANAEKPAGTELMVIGETSDWYIVQCRNGSAGSSFIRKSWFNGSQQTYVQSGTQPQVQTQTGQSSQPATSYAQQTGTMAVVTAPQSLWVRKTPEEDAEKLGTLHTYDRVEKIGYEINGFQGIKYEYCGATVCAYVTAKYLMDIIE